MGGCFTKFTIDNHRFLNLWSRTRLIRHAKTKSNTFHSNYTYFFILCRSKITGGTCLNAQSLMRTFSCKSTYNISIWSWGPPRNVSVKPPPVKTTRAVTPFNNLIGGLIITQSRRKESFCPVDPPPQIKALINTFHCQVQSLCMCVCV